MKVTQAKIRANRRKETSSIHRRRPRAGWDVHRFRRWKQMERDEEIQHPGVDQARVFYSPRACDEAGPSIDSFGGQAWTGDSDYSRISQTANGLPELRVNQPVTGGSPQIERTGRK